MLQLKNSKCDRTQNSKCHNSKTQKQNKTKKNQNVTNPKKKTQIATKLISLNCDKTHKLEL